ncbi:MAG: hypothetical protein J5I93_25240 [Pirellulaceae bacterium]|nr:hypothetical protein [Pirellulaceae bacterium]
MPFDLDGDFLEQLAKAFQDVVGGHAIPPDGLDDWISSGGIDLTMLDESQLRQLADLCGDFPEAILEGQVPESVVWQQPIDLPQAPLRFGGLGGIEALADSQGARPICATEMIENITQLMFGDVHGVWNDLSDRLQELAGDNHWGTWKDGGLVLEPAFYQRLLDALGIDSHWFDFDIDTVRAALDSGRPVGAFVDVAHLGYQTSGAHAITLTDVVTDSADRVVGFKGLDSNFPGQECQWTAEQLAGGVRSLQAGGAWWTGKILIPDGAARWPHLT